MKNRFFSKLLAVLMVVGSTLVMVTASFDAEARRFGGGFSSGRQSANVMQKRQATPAAATPARGAAAAQGAKAGGSRWLGPLAGIAAGLGLAALLSHFGLGGALADLLVIALIAGAVLFAFRYFASRNSAARTANQGAGAGGATGQNHQRQMFEAPGQAAQNRQQFGGAGAATASEPVVGSWFIPADFDQQTFLDEAKRQFVAVQKAWDDADHDTLRARLTEDLYGEFAGQLQARTEHKPTDVVMLNAELLGIEKLHDGYMASVRFSGMIREDDAPEAASFEEVWNLEKPDNQGWLLAGIQQI